MTIVHTIEYLDLSSIKPDPQNPRTHSKKQTKQITDSVQQFNFFNPILVRAETSEIICGHGRYRAAQMLGWEEIPVIRISGLSNAEAVALRIADNKIALNAGWDPDLLRVQLGEVELAGLNVEITGFSVGEIDLSLVPAADPSDDAPLAVPVTPVTRPGDVWVCGHHRVCCGNLLDGTSLSALMAGELADAVVTDPPYNVRINGFANAKGRHREFEMASGEMTDDEFRAFIAAFMALFIEYSRNGAVHFLCMDWRHIEELIGAGRAAYGDFLNLCVWNKSNAGMGSLYRSKYELIAVFRVGDAPHFNAVELGKHGRNRTNVWEYASVNSFVGSRREDLALHPTVKPAALVADAVQDVTRRGEIVLDGFLGSGTLLIACERTGRRARGLEIDPAYVDVAVERWMAMTGREAVLQGTGETFSVLRAAVEAAHTLN